MLLSVNKSKLGKILLPFLLLSSILLLVGCARAPARGWSGPLVSDNVLYVGTIGGKVIALDVSEDQPRLVWDKPLGTPKAGGALACSAQIARPMSTYGTPAIGEDKVYVGGYDGYIYSFRIDDGSMSKFDTGSAIVGSPIIAGDTVFVGNSDGKLYALSLNLSPKWAEPFKTGDKIWSTPAVDNGVVYIGSSDHKLYAIDIESGKEIWHFETRAGILSTPLVFDDTVYIGSCDYNFYAIDAATGEEKWAFESGNWFWTKALTYNDEIWVGCLDHKVYVLDTENGEKIWEFETGGMVRTPPVLIDELIVIGSEDGNLYRIDPISKEPRGEPVSLGAPILAPLFPDPEKGVVYVHAQDGEHTLYAIEVETGKQLWSPPYKTSG